MGSAGWKADNDQVKLPSPTNFSKEEDISTELLGIRKGEVLFLQFYIWLGFKCYEMLLIRTKGSGLSCAKQS